MQFRMNSSLVYDYTKPTGVTLPDELGAEIGKPSVLDQVGAWLAESKWQLVSIDDWTDRYVTAYDDLLERFIRHRAAITMSAGEAWYEYVTGWYGALHQALAANGVPVILLRLLVVDDHSSSAALAGRISLR